MTSPLYSENRRRYECRVIENEILTQVISSDLKALIIHCQQQKSLQQASPQMLEQLPLLFEYQLTDDIVEANDG